jgi:hypothetical protein
VSSYNNRVRIVYFPDDLLLSLLNRAGNLYEFFALPITDELPEGCKILRVAYCCSRKAIEMLVTHPSFDEVPVCSEPPSISFVEFRVVHRDVMSPGDGYEFCQFSEAEDWYDFKMNCWKELGMAGYHGDCKAYRKSLPCSI